MNTYYLYLGNGKNRRINGESLTDAISNNKHAVLVSAGLGSWCGKSEIVFAEMSYARELLAGKGGAEIQLTERYYDSDGGRYGYDKNGVAIIACSVDDVAPGKTDIVSAFENAADMDGAEKIVSIRKAAGYSQQALADAAGINISQVQKLEAGTARISNITLGTAAKLAAALNIDIKSLLD